MTNPKTPQAFRLVYLLQHVAREGSDDEDVKVLGIYSNKKNVELAVERFKKLVGFKRFPEGFYVDPYRLNQDEWSEGFATMRRPPRKKQTPRRSQARRH